MPSPRPLRADARVFGADDATSELTVSRVDGRAAVLASFRDAVAMFDRPLPTRVACASRTDRRIEDGRVHIIAVVRYERAALAPLEVTGEEWFTFEGDRIKQHVDCVVNAAEVMEYLVRHGDALQAVALSVNR